MEPLPLRAGGELPDIIDRYQNMVYGTALAKTNSPADADDVFQEVFLAYFQSRKSNHGRRITTSSWRRKTAPLEEDLPVQFREPEEDQVWSALMSLEDAYRLPLYLYYFQELSTEEVARALSLRPGTARMRLSRGREKLRELLKGDFFDE